MVKYSLFYLFVFISSCVPAKTQNSMNLELTIYPSGGGEKGYSIIIENNSLKSRLRSLGAEHDSIVLTEVKKEEAIMLSNVQMKSLNSLLEHINLDLKSNENPIMLDTWIYVIAIDNQEIARFNSLTLLEKTENKQLECLKQLINQLVELSPLMIDTQSFS